MADQDTGTVDAPVVQEESSGVEVQGNISLGELAGMLVQTEESETPESVSTEGEETVGEATETESETEVDSEADGESTEEAPEGVTQEDEDVLSQLSPKAADKARKRINKLTREKKDADEAREAEQLQHQQELETLTQRLEAIEKGKQKEETSNAAFSEQVKQAETYEDLQSLHKVAQETRDWCRRNQHRTSATLGKDENGDPRVLDSEEIANMLIESEKLMEQDIPKRAQFLQVRQNAAQNTLRDFPAWNDKSNPDHQRLLTLWNDDTGKAMFHGQPNGPYLAAVMLEGLKVLEARSKPAEEKPVATEEKPVVATPKQPAVAPRVPGVDGANVPKAIDNDSERQFQKKTSVSTEDLVAHFAAMEQRKRNQR